MMVLFLVGGIFAHLINIVLIRVAKDQSLLLTNKFVILPVSMHLAKWCVSDTVELLSEGK